MNRDANLWLNKRKTFILLITTVMIVILGVSFIDMFREEESKDNKGNDSMYNSYRFFFRIYYPDDWDVEDDDNKFMLDKEQNLVLELFPLKEQAEELATESEMPVSPTPTVMPSTEASATVDPKAGMQRDETFTMSFYYKKYDDIRKDLEELAKDENTEGGSVNIQDASAQPTTAPVDKAPASNKIIAEYLFEKFKQSKADSNYMFYSPKITEGKTISFMALPFEYVENDVEMRGELYIASRGMAYYEILVEATSDSFEKYEEDKDSIIRNMEFSVFDY